MSRIVFLMGLLLLLSFCSQVSTRFLPYPEGIVFPVEQVEKIGYEGEIASGIFQKEGSIFFATKGGDILCLDSSNFAVRWKFQVGEPLISSLGVGDQCLFVSDQKNSFHCLDLQGSRRWMKTFERRITGPPAEIGETVYIGLEEGQLVALDKESGREKWRFKTDAAVRSNPVEVEGGVAFGCDDRFIYVLDRSGALIKRMEMEGGIGATLLALDKNLYFGTENGSFICIDMKQGIVRWKIKTGGALSSSPVIIKNRIYFLTWNSVVYCVHRNTGSILWWKAIPSRMPFRLLAVEGKIVVSSQSSVLICLDAQTSSIVGRADVGGEMKSNAVWIPPHLYIGVFERDEGNEKIVVLKKQVKIGLFASLESPQEVNTEVVFSAEAIGFHHPQFEFFLSEDGQRRTVQEKTDKSSWSWFPSEPGNYRITVSVKDERQELETEIPYVVKRPKPQVFLSSSVPSPQRVEKNIIFSVTSKGLTEPEYQLRIFRLARIPFGAGGFLSIEAKDRENISRESPDRGLWTWIPQAAGLFQIRIIASDDENKVEASRYFLIMKGKI